MVYHLNIIFNFISFNLQLMQTSIRTRRSNGSTNDSTFGGILNSFSNENSTKGIIKKISSEIAQLLLAQAFQVILGCFLITLEYKNK